MSFILPGNSDRLICTLHRAQCLSCLCVKGAPKLAFVSSPQKWVRSNQPLTATDGKRADVATRVFYSDVMNVFRTPFISPELMSGSRHVLARVEVVWLWGVRSNKPNAYH